jgi:type IV pilus biogenesis protein CpaD/CtpE
MCPNHTWQFEKEKIIGLNQQHISESKGKLVRISYLVCSKKSQKCGNFCTSYVVNSQIWLNLPWDDHHFGCITKFLENQLLNKCRNVVMIGPN